MPPTLIGGPGRVLKGTATTTAQLYEWQGGRSNWFYFENLDPTSTITLYFTEADKDAGNGILIPPGIGTPGNPLSLPLQAASFWMKSDLGDADWRLLICTGRG